MRLGIRLRILSRNKKGYAPSFALGWFLKHIFTIVIVLTAVLIIAQGYDLDNQTRILDAKVIAESLLFSPVIMNYDPVSERVYYGNVNISRFEDSNFEGYLGNYIMNKEEVNYMAMRITPIIYHEGSSEMHKPGFYNKELFEKHMTYIDAGWSGGEGGYQKYIHYFIVTIGEKHMPGMLKVEVTLPNG